LVLAVQVKRVMELLVQVQFLGIYLHQVVAVEDGALLLYRAVLVEVARQITLL
jgi:hypothetical protein